MDDDDADDDGRRIPMRGTTRVVDERVDARRRGQSDDDADVAGADGCLERGARGEGLEQV